MNTSDAYYLSNFTESEELALALILGIIIVLALFGNFGMIIVLFQNDKMWNSTNMLIGNLAFSSIFVSIFCMPFSLISVINGEWPFEEGAVCQFNAFNTSGLLLATIWTHTMISVDKYFYVVKPFSRVMTTRNAWKMIGIIWLLAILMSVVPLFNFGKFAYNGTTMVCGLGFPKSKTDRLYLFILAIVGFVAPILVISYVYIRVSLAVQKHTKRIQTSTVCSLDVVKLQKRLIHTVVSSFACFLLCWVPFFVFVLLAMKLKSADNIPHGMGVAAYWCSYLNNALNPLIICSMSKRFGDGLIDIAVAFVRLPAKILPKNICCFNHPDRTLENVTKETADGIVIKNIIHKYS